MTLLLVTSVVKQHRPSLTRLPLRDFPVSLCRNPKAIAAANCLLGSLCSMQLGDQLTGNSPPTFIQASESVNKIGDLLMIATRDTSSTERPRTRRRAP
jgi:hypothetical protein